MTKPADDRPFALVLRAAGTNCDAELCRAFELAGCRVGLSHIDRLAADPGPFEQAAVVAFPGGFSYGDDIASGRAFAARARETLWRPLTACVDRGCPVIGVCNGFQVLVQLGLLPGPVDSGPLGGRRGTPSLALAENAGGRFIDRWVRVRVDAGTACLWTAELAAVDDPDAMLLPVANGEGRLIAADAEVLESIERGGRVALRYAEAVNGSANDIAGVCDASGRVFGLMPHPERYLSWLHHPYWTRLDAGVRSGPTPGLRIFAAGVRAAVAAAGV